MSISRAIVGSSMKIRIFFFWSTYQCDVFLLIQLGLLAAKQTKRSSPKLAISCDIAEKSIAVAGDVLEACEEYYLNMTTIYGRFTMIAAINYG